VHRPLDCGQLGVSELRGIEIAGVLRHKRDGTRSGDIPEHWPRQGHVRLAIPLSWGSFRNTGVSLGLREFGS
jgi:hypothetical protein